MADVELTYPSGKTVILTTGSSSAIELITGGVVVMDNPDFAVQLAGAVRDSATLPLASIGGTGDAITAALDPAVTVAGIVTLSDLSSVEYIPTATNAAENPTITIAGTSYGIRDADGGAWRAGGFVVGRAYVLSVRGSTMRVIAGEVTSSDVQEISDELASDYESVEQDGVDWFGFDTSGNAILGWSSGGLRVRLDDWTAADVGPRVLSDPATEVELGTYETLDGRVLQTDAAGNALWMWRNGDNGGLDAIMSQSFWDRGRAALNITAQEVSSVLSDPATEVELGTSETLDGRSLITDADGNAVLLWQKGATGGLDAIMSQSFWDRGRGALDLGRFELSDTAWQAISDNGQSGTVGGPWDGSLITRDEFMSRVNHEYALMLTGTRDGDNVLITHVAAPRAKGYNKSVPATGVAPANPSNSDISTAVPLAYIVNAYRADLGLPLVPIITQCHGISGIQIENMDDDPTTGSGDTTVWENIEFWYEQVVAQAAAQGKVLTVPWHNWVHGTSAKSYAPGVYESALWSHISDFHDLMSRLGIPGQAVFLMGQPSGSTNTSSPTDYWHVCDEILNVCEAGGGVLKTPEYAYQIRDNLVHHDAYWTIQFQEVGGRAIAEVEAGRKWTICRPMAKVNGNTVTLDFDSLRPGEYLVLHDPARYGGQGIDAYAGFEAVGATITGIEIRGRQVILACSAAPTGIRYAMQKQDVSGFAGNVWTAHRGLLRTSDVWPSKLLPGVDLYRWVPSFTMSL